MSRRLVSVALLVQLGGLVACKSQVLDLVQDPSFTYDSAAHARIGLLGLAAGEPSSQQTALDRLLTTAMTQERPQLVFAPEVVRNNLGEVAGQALQEFGQKGSLSPQSLAAIKARDPGFGYLLVARLEKNRVRGTTSYEEAEVRVNGKKVDAKSDDGQRLMNRSLQTQREILLKAAVYTVSDGRLVWEARRPEVASSRIVSHPIGSNAAIGLELGGIVSGSDITEDHPPPPDLAPLLAKALAALAENLPEPPS